MFFRLLEYIGSCSDIIIEALFDNLFSLSPSSARIGDTYLPRSRVAPCIADQQPQRVPSVWAWLGVDPTHSGVDSSIYISIEEYGTTSTRATLRRSRIVSGGSKSLIANTAAESLIPASLELGGKAPAIVWKDADLDAAVDDFITARISNTGQICTCAERIYVHSEVAEEFTEKFVAAAEDVTLGDPRDDPDMGPQVSESELESTHEAVEKATDEGARVLTGGNLPEGEEFENGYWYTPTVLTDVTQDMEIIQEEVFGPVSPIVEIDSMDQALEYANDSEYGLSSYLFTNNYRLVNRIADELEFGETYINRTLGEEAQGHHIGWNNSGLDGSDGEDGKYRFLKYTKLKTLYHNYEDPAGRTEDPRTFLSRAELRQVDFSCAMDRETSFSGLNLVGGYA